MRYLKILRSQFLGDKPRIAISPTIERVDMHGDLKKSERVPNFIVASVEVGNTTTKCILTATDLKEGRTRLLNKTVKMTRDVRKPNPGERIFGTTLNGVHLTRESIAELIRDTIIECHREVGLDIKNELDFAVRSTGVVAGFSSPQEVGEFIKALADGAIMAGIPPGKMVPALSMDNIPRKFREYCLIDKITFNGTVAGVFPPKGSTGVEIVANEMEGELATAGIKEGAKWAGVDFRNPCFSMDFGTTLKGRITDAGIPYAKTIGNLCGYAGAIPDAIVRGTGLVDGSVGSALELFEGKVGAMRWARKGKIIEDYANSVHKCISIEHVPMNRTKYGSVPINPEAAEEIGVALIGCDVGENGSLMPELREIGKEAYESHGLETLFAVLDVVSAKIAMRIIEIGIESKLITKDTAIGITGRAGITGCKPNLILKYIKALGLYEKPVEKVVFVDDGLARGAAVMARCMNSYGSPRTPIGGVQSGKCVLAERIKYARGGHASQ